MLMWQASLNQKTGLATNVAEISTDLHLGDICNGLFTIGIFKKLSILMYSRDSMPWH